MIIPWRRTNKKRKVLRILLTISGCADPGNTPNGNIVYLQGIQNAQGFVNILDYNMGQFIVYYNVGTEITNLSFSTNRITGWTNVTIRKKEVGGAWVQYDTSSTTSPTIPITSIEGQMHIAIAFQQGAIMSPNQYASIQAITASNMTTTESFIEANLGYIDKPHLQTNLNAKHAHTITKVYNSQTLVGSNETFTIYSQPGYIVQEVEVDGAANQTQFNPTQWSYIFNNVIANHYIIGRMSISAAPSWTQKLLFYAPFDSSVNAHTNLLGSTTPTSNGDNQWAISGGELTSVSGGSRYQNLIYDLSVIGFQTWNTLTLCGWFADDAQLAYEMNYFKLMISIIQGKEIYENWVELWPDSNAATSQPTYGLASTGSLPNYGMNWVKNTYEMSRVDGTYKFVAMTIQYNNFAPQNFLLNLNTGSSYLNHNSGNDGFVAIGLAALTYSLQLGPANMNPVSWTGNHKRKHFQIYKDLTQSELIDLYDNFGGIPPV